MFHPERFTSKKMNTPFISISKLCRTCLCENNEMESIYNCIDDQESSGSNIKRDQGLSSTETKIDLACMITTITATSITSDNLSNKICKKCAANVKFCYYFKKQCETSFESLKIMSKELVLKKTAVNIDHRLVNEPASGAISKNVNTGLNFVEGIKLMQQSTALDAIQEIRTEDKQTQTDEFNCEMCDKTFNHERLLKDHRLEHSNKTCRVCNKTFSRIPDVQRHFLNVHRTSNLDLFKCKPKCEECAKNYVKNSSLLRHLKSYKECGENTTNIKYAKHITNAIIKRNNPITINDAKRELRMVHMNTDGKWECNNCGNICDNEDQMRRHDCNRAPSKAVTFVNKTKSENDDLEVEHEYTTGTLTTTALSTATAAAATTEIYEPINTVIIKEESPSDNCDIKFLEIVFSNDHDGKQLINTNDINNDNSDNEFANDPYGNVDGDANANVNDSSDNNRPYKTMNENLKKNRNKKIPIERNFIDSFNGTDEYDKDRDIYDDDYPQVEHNTKFSIFERRSRLKQSTKSPLERKMQSQSENKIRISTKNNGNTISSSKKKTLNPIKIKISCDLCKLKFVDFQAFSRHKEWHANPDKKIIPTCTICNAVFKRNYALNRHMATHSDDRPFECSICKKTFKHRENLSAHKLVHAKDRLTCIICDITFKCTADLIVHKKDKHTAIKNSKAVREKSIICDICTRGFIKLKDLKLHMKRHTMERIYKCKFCPEVFKSKLERKEHLKSHPNEFRPFLCFECGSRFAYESQYQDHMQRHAGVKPYHCKFCDKAFTRNNELMVHERYHTDEKPYICSICGKGFHRSTHLVIHTRTHTGERPYKCTFCTNAYTQLQDLKTHIRRHTGEHFKCDICGAAFIQRHLLSQHKRNIHGLKIPSITGRLEKFVPSADGSALVKLPPTTKKPKTVTAIPSSDTQLEFLLQNNVTQM